MVGIVLVSHSEDIANGIKELSLQMAPDANLALAGGTADGRLGTDANKIMEAIESVYCEDGVIVLFDLGSAYMNTEMAIEFLDEDKQKNVEIIDAALVEGAITAIVESSIGKSKEEIKKALKNLELGKMP
ncbi:dihydroxyacetone kinase phosphoryl donor subunit DhaM [Clostridium fallax]|uniref:phosphoenolpyruvate--glycerone phosphotransferase n=1 Tax=Clostridium fallax TaxID=1533 RepID=A0A1M4SHH9_9CLOT|nr:dihydroxyacetone kinase phosphoryl donor subunit DhaM [Clostridium fallax]SHE31665.1 dihydroxyacetone kinase DhaM subunit [Clostridium fallax]SQB07834.1 PTS system mannnose-specific transporter subunit IIA [Clostridium fallax]